MCKETAQKQRECNTLMFQSPIRESGEQSINSWVEGAESEFHHKPQPPRDTLTQKCETEDYSQISQEQQWCDISEVIESDFLISPGDIYLKRKVEMEDAKVKECTKTAFEALCD